MDKEKKFVTLEAFEQYHKKLIEYIDMHDDLMLDGETTCPKCGATITSDKCAHCAEAQYKAQLNKDFMR